jgi:flagellar biosynthesis protein FlhF
MRIKTFYARSMQAALGQIKQELGPDALILSSREFPPSGSTGAASGFEVVAAVDEEGFGQPESRANDAPRRARIQTSGRRDSGLLRQEDTYSFRGPAVTIESNESSAALASEDLSGDGIREKLTSVSARASRLEEGPMRECRRLLLSKEISESLTSHLLEVACSSLHPGDRLSLPALQRAVAAAACGRVSRSGSPEGLPGKRVVVFVGPTGVGKTTSIAKLAARLALRHRKKVVLLSLDGYRIGAVEQLKTYAGLMGMPFRFVRDVPSLAHTIGECSQRDHILVDTTGYGPRNAGPLLELGRFLATFGDAECHLVMSATTKPRDIPEITSRFECCNPDHLLFSKLDETTTLGPILDELVRTAKPMRYYTDGQRVPEDFHTAPPERIVNLVLN